MPSNNPITVEKVELGRRLFYDVRLSGNGTQACASCHVQEHAFTDGRAHALGSSGESHPRSAMSLANVAYNVSLTWANSHGTRLEDQMLVPLFGEHPVEMGSRGREKDLLARLRSEVVYAEQFPNAFPGEADPVSLLNVRRAIASFERTLLSGESPYDQLVWRDDQAALSESARRGMTLFYSDRLACSKCHAGFTFSGPVRWEGSPAAEPGLADNGLGGPFRIPTLRNVAVTAPYMHDGRLATLHDVIDYYAKGGNGSPGQSRLVKGFTVTAVEKTDLIAFLASLTDEAFLKNPRFSNPWKH